MYRFIRYFRNVHRVKPPHVANKNRHATVAGRCYPNSDQKTHECGLPHTLACLMARIHLQRCWGSGCRNTGTSSPGSQYRSLRTIKIASLMDINTSNVDGGRIEWPTTVRSNPHTFCRNFVSRNEMVGQCGWVGMVRTRSLLSDIFVHCGSS